MATKLASYMEKNRLTDSEMGALVGRDRSIISKVRRGALRPTLELAASIERATAGAVTMQSWASTRPTAKAGVV